MENFIAKQIKLKGKNEGEGPRKCRTWNPIQNSHVIL